MQKEFFCEGDEKWIKDWLINYGTGLVQGGTGWYLVVLGQYRVVQVDI